MSLLRLSASRPLCHLCKQTARPTASAGRGYRASQEESSSPRLIHPRRQQPREQVEKRPTPVETHTTGKTNPLLSTSTSYGVFPSLITDRVEQWVASDDLVDRLELFGFDKPEARPHLSSWACDVRDELKAAEKLDDGLPLNLSNCGWDVDTLMLAQETGTFEQVSDAAFLRHFVQWAVTNGPERIRMHLRSLLQATDISNLAHRFVPARALKRRFHLHLGPSDSGKAAKALKTLREAKSGVYASPLRPVAREVWERLNLGSTGALEGDARACNLLTEDEAQVVDAEAGLMSCTIEMLPMAGVDGEPWDVAVIDEVQMLADQQRGGAWTTAIMGLNAKEIHLCGDESTAGLLESLIGSFPGDELTIHRYERARPTVIESLDNNFDKLDVGDCIVTFTREAVFSVKKMAEKTTAKKAAVAYRELPAEVRAEQCRLFNEDYGRQKLLVADETVATGLNVKIGRVIFESLTRHDGEGDVPIPLSTIQRIASRAGRFGTTEGEGFMTDEKPAPPGQVTTMHAAEFPLLQAMLSLPTPPVTRAYINIPREALDDLSPLLPPNTTLTQLHSTFSTLAKLPPHTLLTPTPSLLPHLEPHRQTLTLSETTTFLSTPATQDTNVLKSLDTILTLFPTSNVRLDDTLAPTKLLNILKTVEETLGALPPLPPHLGIFRPYLAPSITIAAIPLLENLHTALMTYLSLSTQYPLAFPDRPKAQEYKTRVEKVLDICLNRLPGHRQLFTHERKKAWDHELALYRRKYVDKHGLVKPDIEWVREQLRARGGRVAAQFDVGSH